jgi:arylsulfatase A-like enzyme
VFLSDNGGDPTVGGNAPYKGCKATLFEGGVRVPTFVHAASTELLPRAARGGNLTAITHVSDWYPTFCTLAGVDPRDDQPGTFPVDGVDLWPHISAATAGGGGGGGATAVHDTLVLGHEFALGATAATGALLAGRFKLIVGAQPHSDYRGPLYPCVLASPGPNCNPNCLFDTETDPYERVNLVADPAHGPAYARLLALYAAESNLYQNVSVDQRGFEHAVDSVYHGYVGPWLDLD